VREGPRHPATGWQPNRVAALNLHELQRGGEEHRRHKRHVSVRTPEQQEPKLGGASTHCQHEPWGRVPCSFFLSTSQPPEGLGTPPSSHLPLLGLHSRDPCPCFLRLPSAPPLAPDAPHHSAPAALLQCSAPNTGNRGQRSELLVNHAVLTKYRVALQRACPQASGASEQESCQGGSTRRWHGDGRGQGYTREVLGERQQ